MEQAQKELTDMRTIADDKIAELKIVEGDLLTARSEMWKEQAVQMRADYYAELEGLNTDTQTMMQKITESLRNALPAIQLEAQKIRSIVDWATGLEKAMPMLNANAQLENSTPSSMNQSTSTNVYNITTPEPLTEREIVRQIELSERRLAAEIV
jgi:hypothetical protein